jgi:hypothetical protein
MSIANELLELAQAALNAGGITEAALRRATSTAYYAMFHLLVGEATANRPLFGRVFEHGKMKAACIQIPGVSPRPKKQQPEIPFELRTSADHLRVVALTFVRSQEFREFADYDLSTAWTREDLEVQVSEVTDAFRSWSVIREELEAQKFLVLLLEPKQRASRV